MTIINNRKKIASEVPSQKYKDNYDAIFGKKHKSAKDYEEESQNDKVQCTDEYSSCLDSSHMCDCSCLQEHGKD